MDVTRDMAIAAMEEAVALKGADHAVWACSYVQNGEPACLVGYALTILGVPMDVLKAMDTPRSAEINTIRVKELLRAQNVTLDWPTLLVFTTAQARQDNGIPWGEALAAAKADKGDQ